ncbi:hypothetical protein [endosymbiont GvMRE of Glomus versiforme]|uniref:hypothetical protein n=1 Tax=endosymbiont GvMRE of Glomus versiforme TaxID=2039283 RepID=UPI000EDCDB8C|nr:hypothetical protein [endosymbiont GvMRE of Glomus versiforme]RHZ37185.1 hypothetical protein GvMRE_I1g272 [endosymbiont GvMRE of Glomus versiforme]
MKKVVRHYEFSKKEDREKIKVLYIQDKKLQGHLDFSDFTSLKELDCCDNNLTSLELSGCPNLESFSFYNKQPVDFNLSRNIHKKLKYLICDFSKLSEPKRTEYLKWSWENIRDKVNFLLPGLEKLIDTSDLDDWVENYDWNRIGDVEYHKFCGNKAGDRKWVEQEFGSKYANFITIEWFKCLDYKALDSLGDKVFARKSIVLKCLLIRKKKLEDDEFKKVNKRWEEKRNLLAEGCNLLSRGNPVIRVWDIEQQEEVVDKALAGDIELLSRLQDLPYLKEEFNFSKNPQLVLKEIIGLKEELQMEREEVEKALQKAQEWKERQIKELRE